MKLLLTQVPALGYAELAVMLASSPDPMECNGRLEG
jgi:hypothetical protein